MTTANAIPMTTMMTTPLLKRLWLGIRSLNVLKDDMANSDHARILHLSFDCKTYAKIAKAMRATEDGCALLDARKSIPGERSLEELAALPEGTLGHVYANYFASHNIEPFGWPYPVENDADFLVKRYRETHDIHHIITGYGIDDLGEIEIQAFYLGNLGLKHAMLISATWMPVQFFRTGLKDLGTSWRKLKAAYRRGKASRMLLGARFDELWERPVEALSQELLAPR